MSETLNTNTEQTLPNYPENQQNLEAIHQETLNLVAEKLGAVAAGDYANFSPLANRETGSFGPTGAPGNIVVMQHTPENTPTFAPARPASAEQQPAAHSDNVVDLAAYREQRNSGQRPVSGSAFPPHPNIQLYPVQSQAIPAGRRSRWARFRDRFKPAA